MFLGLTGAAFAVEQPDRSPTIWDVIAAAPGRIADGSTDALRIDHPAHRDTDLALLRRSGADAHRFSIAWARVCPDGAFSAAGLAGYDRWVDDLLGAGIRPWVELYHADLPLDRMLEGGWLERDVVARFADYAGAVATRLADRVDGWVTIADPFGHMAFGHAAGVEAPGLTLLDRAFGVTHHLLLGHAAAAEAVRAAGGRRVGLTTLHAPVHPVTPGAADRRAARLLDVYLNRQFAEPVLRGRYPRLLRPYLDTVVQDGDLDRIAVPGDFYGVDYAFPLLVSAATENPTVPFTLHDPESSPAEGGWTVRPDALGETLRTVHARWPDHPPLLVTDVGAAYPDHPDDLPRIAHLHRHLAAVHRAEADGIDVLGYFHRSLLDGWEGTDGFTRHYGLVAVDPDGSRRPRPALDAFRSLPR
jgi:beta-glucosidase